jgi:hypothetical protein
LARTALFLLLMSTAFTVGGCKRKSAGGYEPIFREDFPGTGCKALKVETGTYEKLCSKPPEFPAACPVGWKDLEGAQVAVIRGEYEGPICLLDHDECEKPEKINFLGAALKLPNGPWEPGGLLVIGGRRIDARATLFAGCAKPAGVQGR